MNILYPALLEPQPGGGYCVRFPDFEEAVTEGDTQDEALFNAADLLTLTLEARMDEGLELPPPSLVDGAHLVAPDAKTQAALLVLLPRNLH